MPNADMMNEIPDMHEMNDVNEIPNMDDMTDYNEVQIDTNYANIESVEYDDTLTEYQLKLDHQLNICSVS